MIYNELKHISDIDKRTQVMLNDIKSEKKLQHKMSDSAPDFLKIQDLYLNSLIEWYRNPKCEICFNCKGIKP